MKGCVHTEYARISFRVMSGQDQVLYSAKTICNFEKYLNYIYIAIATNVFTLSVSYIQHI